MEYRYLGNTGVKVSKLCFGTMSFGGDADKATSLAMFQRCREVGINFFDCANVYQHGIAEEILGECIANCRNEVLIATKVYFPMNNDINARGSSRWHILRAVEDSLRRLKTDRIDVYFLHRFDDVTPLEETLRAMDDMVTQGKVVYIGASNFAAWQAAKALGVSERYGWARFEVFQPMYSLVKRQAEVEILPMALAENISVIPYSPLGAGLLSGKYSTTSRPVKGRLVENKMYQLRYGSDWIYETAGKLTEYARQRGLHPATVAVAWVASHPAVTAPLIGARSLEQLEPSLKAADLVMTPEMRAEISALSPEPPPATDRDEERTTYDYAAALKKA